MITEYQKNFFVYILIEMARKHREWICHERDRMQREAGSGFCFELVGRTDAKGLQLLAPIRERMHAFEKIKYVKEYRHRRNVKKIQSKFRKWFFEDEEALRLFREYIFKVLEREIEEARQKKLDREAH